MRFFILNAVRALTAICVFLVAFQADAQWEMPKPGRTLITGGWVFDGLSDARVRNTGVLIEAGKIVSLAAQSSALAKDVKRVTLGPDDTLIPGLIDLHAHYNMDILDQGRVEEVAYNGLVFLANGVTATWSAGEFQPERVMAQQQRIAAGVAAGPRLFHSGPYFGGFRCEYNVKVAADECAAWPNDITEAEIRAEVDYWAGQGVISLKIKQATPGEAKVIIEQAHAHGMTTAGHLANYDVEYDVDARDAILMGIDRIEHQLTLGSGGPKSAEMDQMVALMIAHQVYYGPNLQMYGGINERRKHAAEMLWYDEAQFFTPYARRLLERRGPPPPESDAPEFAQRVRELMALYDAGGGHLITVGTDEPVYTLLLPGFAYHRELLAMTYAGLAPLDALKAATINGARALGIEGRVGSITVGKFADLVAVRANPLEDIKAARDIAWVMKNGTFYDPQALLDQAKGKIGPTGPNDHADWILNITPLRGR